MKEHEEGLCPFVVFTRGAWAGQRLTLDAGHHVFGREAGQNVVVLRDASVSNRHAEINHMAEGWFITDLHSLNGTWVNGDKVENAYMLHHGDRIRMGDVHLCLWFGAPWEEHRATHLQGLPDRHPVPAGVQPLLSVTAGPDEGTQYVIKNDTTIIGRASGGDLILRDPAVHSAHAVVAYIDGFFVLLVLGDQHAFVDDHPVGDGLVLRHGSRVQVGNTTMVFWEDG